MDIEKIKKDLAIQEKTLTNKAVLAMLGEGGSEKIKAKIELLKKQINEAEGKAEEKVEKAEEKIEDAETKAEKKEAKEELKEAKEEKKDIEKLKKDLAIQEKTLTNKAVLAMLGEGGSEKIKAKIELLKKQISEADTKEEKKEAKEELIEAEKKLKASDKIEKMERPKSNWGGKRPNAGAVKKKVVASKPTKMVKPKGVQALVVKRVPTKKLVPVKKQVPVKVVAAQKPAKMKTARAFGQIIEYHNDSEFCGELIKAFKKRRKESKVDGKRKKTKPVFGVIATNVKNAVSKALHNVSNKEIEKNPKQFLAKAQRLEKSAIRFLEDFKAILGSDFRKSEITTEFGELEKSIKLFVAKIAKK